MGALRPDGRPGRAVVHCLAAVLAIGFVHGTARAAHQDPKEHCPNVILGTPGDDILVGTEQRDCIHGYGGNDFISGGAGTDLIYAGPGDDKVLGGDEPEPDLVESSPAGQDGDVIFGEDGNDEVDAGAGNDQVLGNDGNDTLMGGPGRDVLQGTAGDDVMHGGPGKDSLYGDHLDVTDHTPRDGSPEGTDRLFGDDDIDVIYGDSRFPLISPRTEDLYGKPDEIHGGSGDDYIVGGGGSDVIFGDDGDDLVYGDIGEYRGDVATPGGEAQAAYGAIAQVDGPRGPAGLLGEADRILGGPGNDTLYGVAADDHLFGEDGNDELYGGDGADTLIGGAGQDRAWVTSDDKFECEDNCPDPSDPKRPPTPPGQSARFPVGTCKE